jgi:2-dehydro-3-deoxygluconokinase
MPPESSSCLGKHDVVTLGEAMLRLSSQFGVRLEAAHRLDLSVAGSECNVAANLAALGIAATWMSRLPRTQLGRRIIQELTSVGVDVAHVSWSDEGRVGLFFVEPGVKPRPSVVLYDRADSAFSSMEPDQLDLDAIDGATWAVVSGITPALSDAAASTALEFMRAAADRGVKTCVDVNYRSRLWPPQRAREGLIPLLVHATVVVCAERDARTVFGLDGHEASVIEGFRRLSPNAEFIVLTQQEQGSLAVSADGSKVRVPYVPATVVDRLGVGDAFLAGFLSGLIGGDVRTAMQRAAAMAALKSTVAGDFARARAEDLEALISLGQDDVLR